MKRKITIDEQNAFNHILKTVAKYKEVHIRSVMQPKCSLLASYARHLTWYFCEMWMPETPHGVIGRMTDKGRTTVVMGIGKIKKALLVPGESQIKKDVLEIAKLLKTVTDEK